MSVLKLFYYPIRGKKKKYLKNALISTASTLHCLLDTIQMHLITYLYVVLLFFETGVCGVVQTLIDKPMLENSCVFFSFC